MEIFVLSRLWHCDLEFAVIEGRFGVRGVDLDRQFKNMEDLLRGLERIPEGIHNGFSNVFIFACPYHATDSQAMGLDADFDLVRANLMKFGTCDKMVVEFSDVNLQRLQ
jgi:hypothetical protein